MTTDQTQNLPHSLNFRLSIPIKRIPKSQTTIHNHGPHKNRSHSRWGLRTHQGCVKVSFLIIRVPGTDSILLTHQRAVNDYEDKKQRRSTQSQYQPPPPYYPSYEPHSSYMQGDQMSYRPDRPQWSASNEAQYHHGNHTSNNRSQEMQSRNRRSSRGEKRISNSPPRYYRALLDGKQDGV